MTVVPREKNESIFNQLFKAIHQFLLLFLKLMGEEPDLDPEILKDFMEQNILQFDPALLTENGMK